MITEESRKQKKLASIEEELKYLKQVVDAAPRYERLIENDDFKAVLEDLKNVVASHDHEIQRTMALYGTAPSFFKQMRLSTILMAHQIQKDQILTAIARPDRIVFLAAQARERIAVLKKQRQEAMNND